MLMTPLAALRTALEVRMDGDARQWLRRALAEAGDSARPAGSSANQPPSWERYFAEAGSRCRRPSTPRPLSREPATDGSATGSQATDGSATGSQATDGSASDDSAPDSSGESVGPASTAGLPGLRGLPGFPSTPEPTDLAESARVLLLHASGADTATLNRLYTHGSGDERRAVLRALPHLESGPDALPLVEDALLSNDPRLVAAAVGPYAEKHLDAGGWRRAVLKCLLTGVPLAAVSGLERRATGDAELVSMLNDYADERTAAGRSHPGDLRRVLELACRSPRRASASAVAEG